MLNKTSALVLTGFLGFAAVGNAVADLNDGLVAYYPFDGNAEDASGNENHGTVYGATLTEGRFGNADSAYYFDGIDDLIRVSNPFSLQINLDTPLSVSTWVKTATNKDSAGIVTQYTACHGEDDYFHITLYGENTNSQLITKVFQSSEDIEINREIIADGQWHHIFLLYQDRTLKLYIDSTVVGTVNVSSLLTFTPSVDLVIGGFSSSTCSQNTNFEGAIDEVRIYNRALSESEIQQIYGKSEQPPIEECPTSSETGTVATDLSIHVPSLDYQTLTGTQNIWVDFEFAGQNENGEMLWKLKNFGVNNQ